MQASESRDRHMVGGENTTPYTIPCTADGFWTRARVRAPVRHRKVEKFQLADHDGDTTYISPSVSWEEQSGTVLN